MTFLKKTTVLFFILAVKWIPVQAQYYFYNDKYYDGPISFELGASVGIMNSLTDIGGNKGKGKAFIKDLNIGNTKPSYGIFATATYKYAIGLRLEATLGNIGAYDTILKKVKTSAPGRYNRNLSFSSRISDFQLSFEIHPLFFKKYEEDESPYFSPYLVAGIGYFTFEPMAELNGRKYSLQPLHTEGQGFSEYQDRKPYQLGQVNFPLGIGLKYEVNSYINARLELVHRFLSTDYLDDVSTNYIDPNLFDNYLSASEASIARQLYARRQTIAPDKPVQIGEQRGNPANKDSYFTVQLKLSLNLVRMRR